MNYQVRVAQISDHKAIVAFQIKMAWETENLELDPGVVFKGVKAVFDDPAKGVYMIASQSNEVVGVMLLTPEWSDWRNGQVLWIQSLYVLPEHRNQGIFKLFYQNLQDKVQNDPKLRGIRLYVDKTNQLAQEVYQKVGMDGNHYQLFEWMK
ncbi:MAG: GNAT family N-acetyltransferase [Candidatus Cyclobacteriaceae bacterium M3_2C_046]